MSFDPIAAINSAMGYVDAMSRAQRHQWQCFAKSSFPMERFQCLSCRRFMILSIDDERQREEIKQIEEGAVAGFCGHPSINEWWKAGGAEGHVIMIDGNLHFDIQDSTTGAVVRVPFGTPDETEPAAVVNELMPERS